MSKFKATPNHEKPKKKESSRWESFLDVMEAVVIFGTVYFFYKAANMEDDERL